MSVLPRYVATLCPGFEDVVCLEIGERLPGAKVVGTDLGRILFDDAGDPAELLRLRSVNHLSVFIGEIIDLAADEGGLSQLERLGEDLDFDPALSILARVRDLPDGLPSFRVTGERVGTHAFTSQQAAAHLGGGIVRARGWPVSLKGYDVEFRLAIAGSHAWVGVALTRVSLHRRGGIVPGRAPLKATVAYGLVRLLDPQPGDIVVDPMCGTGTALVECAQHCPEAIVIGGDVDDRALGSAGDRMAQTGTLAACVRWDARHLPLRYQSVDRLVCNLPFGRRVGSHHSNRHLYPGFVRELRRVLRPGGRAVLLTAERRLLERLLVRECGLRVTVQRNVNLSNLHAVLYIVEGTTSA